MSLKAKTLLTVLFPILMASSGQANTNALPGIPLFPTIPLDGGPALICAMIIDYMGNDQIWFDNVGSLFEEREEVAPRAALDQIFGTSVEQGEPIQIRAAFSRWITDNAIMVYVGGEEVLVVGKKSLFEDPTLDPYDLTIDGIYYGGLNEFCRKGQGGIRFIRAEKIYSPIR